MKMVCAHSIFPACLSSLSDAQARVDLASRLGADCPRKWVLEGKADHDASAVSLVFPVQAGYQLRLADERFLDAVSDSVQEYVSTVQEQRDNSLPDSSR